MQGVSPRHGGVPAPMLEHGQEGEHPAGAAFFGAIRIVAAEIAGGAHAGIVHCRNAEIATLPDNLRGKIDFVMRRANAGAELNHKIGRARTKLRCHRHDRIRNHAQLRPFLARVDESNGAANRIDQKCRATIGDVNAETNPALVGDQPVALLETFAFADLRINDTDLFSMNLPGRNERHAGQTMFVTDFPMDLIETRERFRLVVRHLDAGHAQGEPVNDALQCTQRRELFSQKLTLAHLPEGIVRVVRVVVVVVRLGMGGRFPA